MTATNELREKLEWFRADLCNVGCAIECATWEKRKALIDGVIDEYAQAIAAMLKSDREVELEALVRDWQELYENPDYGECVRLVDRMRKLGIEVER